jgi:hypothetical protein
MSSIKYFGMVKSPTAAVDLFRPNCFVILLKGKRALGNKWVLHLAWPLSDLTSKCAGLNVILLALMSPIFLPLSKKKMEQQAEIPQRKG